MTDVIATKDILDLEGEVLAKEGFHLELLSIEADGAVLVNNDAPWKGENDRVDEFLLSKGEWKPDNFHVVVKDYNGEIESITHIGMLGNAFKNDPERTYQLLSEMLNTYADMAAHGLETGRIAGEKAHRTNYRTMVIWAISFLKGLAKTTFIDDRNRKAHRVAEQIARTEFDVGEFI